MPFGFDASTTFEKQVRKLYCLQLGNNNSHRFQSWFPGPLKCWTTQDNNTAQVRIWYLYSFQVFEVRSVNSKWDHTGPGGSQESDLVSYGDEKNFLSLGGLGRGNSETQLQPCTSVDRGGIVGLSLGDDIWTQWSKEGMGMKGRIQGNMCLWVRQQLQRQETNQAWYGTQRSLFTPLLC